MNKIEHTEQKKSDLKVGQFFRHKDGQTYLLTKDSNNKYHIFCLEDGYSWTMPRENIKDVFSTYEEYFTLVTTPFTITPQ